ncbi:MAG TPA: hypothetical protein VFR14_10135 [Candidatus Limnocylindrales bacterium]|nr:hypothetical protein [Candidatus Limnocylindrales bacterium]
MSTRTTLTLDDDVASGLEREVRRTGRTFRSVVNDVLRAGLERERLRARSPFVVEPADLGQRAGHSIDHVSGLIETAEGPRAR